MERDPSELLTAQEICAELKISTATFYRLRRIGIIPAGIPVGLRGVRWRREVIEQALTAITRKVA